MYTYYYLCTLNLTPNLVEFGCIGKCTAAERQRKRKRERKGERESKERENTRKRNQLREGTCDIILVHVTCTCKVQHVCNMYTYDV